MCPAPQELGTLGLTNYYSPTADPAWLGGEGGPPAWHVSTELLGAVLCYMVAFYC